MLMAFALSEQYNRAGSDNKDSDPEELHTDPPHLGPLLLFYGLWLRIRGFGEISLCCTESGSCITLAFPESTITVTAFSYRRTTAIHRKNLFHQLRSFVNRRR